MIHKTLDVVLILLHKVTFTIMVRELKKNQLVLLFIKLYCLVISKEIFTCTILFQIIVSCMICIFTSDMLRLFFILPKILTFFNIYLRVHGCGNTFGILRYQILYHKGVIWYELYGTFKYVFSS